MNYYIRFFDTETLVTSIDEGIVFLRGVSDIDLDNNLEADIRNYADSDNNYPKRYKVRPKTYFIIIKTNASTIEEFKQAGTAAQEATLRKNTDKIRVQDPLNAVLVGWYDISFVFRRVLPIPGTNKFQYLNTDFQARLKATSVQDSYNRVLDYLRSRSDIDSRSQFPGIKGHNFSANYLGPVLPQE